MALGIKIDRKLILNHKGQFVYRLRNTSGGTISAGATVIFDTANADGFTTTTTADDPKVAGMCLDTVTNGNYAEILVMGFTTLLKVDGTTDIAVGDLLTTFTTAGIAAKRTAVTKGGIFAYAYEAYATNDGNGVIDAWVFPAGRTDASGNTLTYGTAGQMAADGLASANAAGTTDAVSRVDHAHTNTADTPALTLSTSNSAGTAGSVLAANATLALFDTTAPSTIAINDTAAVGSVAFAARRDHTHGFLNIAAPADGSSLASANASGSNNTLSRSDHGHKAIALNDTPLILGTTDAAATAFRIEYDTAETADALKIGVNTDSRRIIICDYADMGSDTALAAAANPELVIMDAAFTDYLAIRTTTSSAIHDIPTGNSYLFQINATTEITIDANGIALAAANYIQNNGAQGALRKMLTDVNGNELLETYGTASAVNHLTLTNSATGTGAILGANGTGADANVGFTLLANGTGAIIIDNGTDPVDLRVMGAAAGFNSKITDVNANELVEFYGTASAVNHLTITNSATGTAVIIGANGTGSTANRGMTIVDSNGNEEVILASTASAVNEVTMTNAATNNAPQIGATGGDANISLRLVPKGTGAVVTGAATTYGRSGGQLELNNTSDNVLTISHWGANTNFVEFNKSTGAVGAYTVIATGNQIGTVSARGADGTDWQQSSYIRFIATGTIGDNRVPGLIEIHALSDAASSVDTTVMSIISTGVTLGVAGTTQGALKLCGVTSGTVTLAVNAAAGTWTMELPAAVGTAGQQLTDASGNGVCTWTAAGSSMEIKDRILPALPETSLDLILSMKGHRFHYKAGKGTGDTETEYVGPMAHESPWAMHYGGTILNPVNTFGHTALAIQALYARIQELEHRLASR